MSRPNARAPIDAEDVRRIARLARLHLDEERVQTFRRQLGSVLDHISELDELQLAGRARAAAPAVGRGGLREDVPQAGLTVEQATRNAPAVAQGCFRVPDVLDQPRGERSADD